MELLANSGQWMADKFEDLCLNVLKLREHKAVLIRRTVLQCIPPLANYSPNLFIDKFLKASVETLLLSTDRERDIAFLAIGELAVTVGPKLAPYSGPIMQSILNILKLRTRALRSSFFPELYLCIGMLAKGLGSTVTTEFKPIAGPPFPYPSPNPNSLSSLSSQSLA